MMHGRNEFIIEVKNGKRKLSHSMIMDDAFVDECDNCSSECDLIAPYSEHWKDDGYKYICPTEQDKATMGFIDREEIEEFIFADESSSKDKAIFLRQTLKYQIPDLLRFMMLGSLKIKFTMCMYLNIKGYTKVFRSIPLTIDHHVDVHNSVDILFEMLKKISKVQLKMEFNTSFNDSTLLRIKMVVSRTKLANHPDAILPVPIMYRHLIPDALSSTIVPNDLFHLIKKLYNKFRTGVINFIPPNLKANLYCIQVCQFLRKPYVMPYYLAEAGPGENIPNYLLIDDVTGELQQMREVTNVERLMALNTQNRTQDCGECNVTCNDLTEWELHQTFQCGNRFGIHEIHPELVEVYEMLVVLKRNTWNHVLYAAKNYLLLPAFEYN